MTMAPVYLVDDDEGVRSALSLLLGTYGIRIETFGDPTAFLARAPKLKPGVLLLDLRMPAITGLQLHEKLGAIGCDWPTIICTGHGDVHACRRAFKAGVTDFLTKPIEEQTLLQAIESAQTRLDQQAERNEARQSLRGLTEREREVLSLVGQGMNNAEIAEKLWITKATARTHVSHIMVKLDARDRAQLVVIAYSAGLVG